MEFAYCPCVHQDCTTVVSGGRGEDRVNPTRKVCCFPSNKPWINRDIKLLLNRKNKAFMAGNIGIAQKGIQRELQRAKGSYKNRIEGKLQQGNTGEVWAWIRNISGMKRATGAVEGTREHATLRQNSAQNFEFSSVLYCCINLNFSQGGSIKLHLNLDPTI